MAHHAVGYPHQSPVSAAGRCLRWRWRQVSDGNQGIPYTRNPEIPDPIKACRILRSELSCWIAHPSDRFAGKVGLFRNPCVILIRKKCSKRGGPAGPPVPPMKNDLTPTSATLASRGNRNLERNVSPDEGDETLHDRRGSGQGFGMPSAAAVRGAGGGRTSASVKLKEA